MDEQKLILADGTEIEQGRAYLSDGELWLMIGWNGRTVLEAAKIFSDETKTERITYVHDEVDEFEGMTDLRMVMIDRDGTMNIKLTRGD